MPDQISPNTASRIAADIRSLKSDSPQSCFDELSNTIQDLTKRIGSVMDEVRTLQAQVLGATDKIESPTSVGPNAISTSVRDHMSDLERTITNLESVVARFR